MQISQKLSLLILAFIAFSADAQENEIENQNVFLNGEIKTHFNERYFSFKDDDYKYYEIKATHFKMRFYRKLKSVSQGDLLDTKFYNAIYSAYSYSLFESDSANLARITFSYSDSSQEEKNGLFGIFRPKREYRYTSYTSKMRTLSASIQLKNDSTNWKLHWAGAPSEIYFDSATKISPKELFLIAGPDTVKMAVSSKKGKRKYELNGYNLYHHNKLFATLTHLKNNKYSYSINTTSFVNNQFIYAVISLCSLMYEERNISFGEKR